MELSVSGSRSAVSNSLSRLSTSEGIPRHIVGTYRNIRARQNTPILSQTIRDFINIKDNTCLREDKNNLTYIINHLCTI